MFLSYDSTYLGLLTVEDALKIMQTSRLMYQTFKKAKGLKKIIRYGNLNTNLRPKYWKKISDQTEVVKEVYAMIDLPVTADNSNIESLYATLMQLIPDDETRLTPKIRDEISKDLARTRTSERITTEEGQEEMRRVLLAIAYCMPDVGYC